VKSENQGNKQSRRDFLKTSTAAAAASTVPFWFATGSDRAPAFDTPNERPVLGCIGTGSRWEGDDGPRALRYSDCVAICDVDSEHAGKASEIVKSKQPAKGKNRKLDVYGDYRRVLDRKDINAVLIVTPDHWHTKIAIEAMKAGKDVYCEKPLTLTIDEGKQIIKALEETKRVFQVGTQQRSEMRLNFLKAIAMVQDGRIGQVKRAICDIGVAPTSGTCRKVAVPPSLNWEMWLGQAPLVDYIRNINAKGQVESRCHYEFRWWYEYSGGKLTDWGAHHVDIAQWAIGMDHSGPTTVEVLHAEHPVPFKNGYPTVDNQYNTATRFAIRCVFPNGVEIVIKDSTPEGNGVLFEGTEGKFHVGRGRDSLFGQPVDALADKPLNRDLITKLYKGKRPGNHMANFFECVKTREQPISDVYTHHRAITTCHLANIAMRLNRTINWDPKTEQIVGDKEAAKWTSREQRKGYEINV
jgi:predicted dehydrogenase